MVNLSHNEIVEIEPYALHQVSIFSTLDVSFNRLETIAGYGLVRLMRLDASHNRLTDVSSDAFVGLHQTFQHLSVAYNNLTTFHADVLFHQTNGLHRLDLSESETSFTSFVTHAGGSREACVETASLSFMHAVCLTVCFFSVR